METPQLDSAGYWQSDSIDVRLNPRLSYDVEGLETFLREGVGLSGAVVIATSGTSGAAKYVVLEKKALLASADSVNAACGISNSDVWWGGLATFHVGGLGIYARAFRSGSRVVIPETAEWNRGEGYAGALGKSGATLTSLTPVHLHDLVQLQARCPESLRGLFLGGGRISQTLVDRAVELGWPVWPTYGMSEACSQIATNCSPQPAWLAVIKGWECRIEPESGRLAIRGDALFSGYAVKRDGDWFFETGKDPEGWFLTGDVVELSNGKLCFQSRSDDLVKVSGELVSLSAVEAIANRKGREAVVLALPDSRRETRLVAVVLGADADTEQWLRQVNAELPPLMAIAEASAVSRFPRSAVGKVDRKQLVSLF